MSSYIERWCPKHGAWDDDVDCPGECPDCEKEGIAPSQIAAREHAELSALRSENARLREALEIIAGEKTGMDDLMGNVDIARAALSASKDAERDKEQENLAKHEDTLRRGDIASRLVSEWLEEYVRENDVHKDILLHLEGDAARSALCELEARIMGAFSMSKGAGYHRGARLSLEQLREIEWASLDGSACPACDAKLRINHSHAPDCWLAALIKQASL